MRASPCSFCLLVPVLADERRASFCNYSLAQRLLEWEKWVNYHFTFNSALLLNFGISMGFVFLWCVGNTIYHNKKWLHCLSQSLLSIFYRPWKSLDPKKLQETHSYLFWKGKMGIWVSPQASKNLFPHVSSAPVSISAQWDPCRSLRAEGHLLGFPPRKWPKQAGALHTPMKWLDRGN